MAKKVLPIALLLVGTALTFATGGIFGTAVPLLFGFTATVGQIAGLALTVASGLVNAKLNKPKSTPTAVAPVTVSRPGVMILSDVYGKTRLGGSWILYNSGETPTTKKNYYTVALLAAAHPLNDILEIWDGDKKLWDSDAGVTSEYSGKLIVDVRLGHDRVGLPAAFSTALPTTLPGTDASNFVCSGKSWVAFQFTDLAENWGNTLPQNLWFLVEGKRILDPRSGLTSYSSNFALVWYDYTRSRGKIPVEYFSQSNVISQANLSDEQVAAGDTPGVFENRYEFNGSISTDVSVRDFRAEMLRHAAAENVWTGDTLLLYQGAYSAPIATLTPDDFLGSMTLTGQTRFEDRWERVEGVYSDPNARYLANGYEGIQLAGLPPDAAASPRVLSVDLAREISPHRARRVGALILKLAQRVRTLQGAVKLPAENIYPGQRVIVELDEGLGSTLAVFRISARKAVHEIGAARVELQMIEDGPDFWTTDAGESVIPPTPLDVNLPDPRQPTPPVTNLVVTPNTRVESDGSITRWIDVSWTAPSDTRYLGYYEVRWMADGVLRSQQTRETNFRINNVDSSVAVTVSVATINVRGVVSSAVSVGSVTPGGDVTPPSVPPSGAIFPIASGFRFRIGNPADADLAGLRLFEGASGAAFGATVAILDVSTTPGGQPTEFTRTGLTPGSVYRYFVAAFDRTGNVGLPFGPLQDTVPATLSQKEIDAAIAGAVATANNAISDAAAAATQASAAISAAQAAQLDADQLRVETDSFAVTYAAGQTTNFLRNSSFSLGLAYWGMRGETADYYYFHAPLSSNWSGMAEDERPILFVRKANAADQQAQLLSLGVRDPADANGATDGWPVKVGEWIEISANVSAENTTALIQLQFRDSAGAVISSVVSNTTTTRTAQNPGAGARLWCKGQVPTGAVRAVFALNLGGSTPTTLAATVGLYRPQMTRSTSTATAPQPYVAGAAGDIGLVDALYSSEVSALATADIALAQSITDLSASLGASQATISTLSLTKVDAAGAIAAVSSKISSASGGSLADVAALAGFQNTLATSISTIRTTKVDATGAVAAVNSQVSAGSGGAIASVSALSTAQQNVNGQLTALYALSVDGGGNGAFLRLIDSAALGSAVTITADVFKVQAAAIFGQLTASQINVSELVVGANLTVAGQAIDTAALANFATVNWLRTFADFNDVGVGTGAGGGPGVTLVSFASQVSNSLAQVHIRISGRAENASFAGALTVDILVNGGLVESAQYVFPTTDFLLARETFMFPLGVAGASIEVQFRETSGSSDVRLDFIDVFAVEFKK